MASALASRKLTSELAAQNYDFNPAATTATYIAWVDLRDFEVFMAGFTRLTGSGTLTTWSIYAATDTSGTNATEVKTATVNPATLNDQVWLECTAAEIAHLAAAAGVSLRYVSVKIQFGTGTDRGLVTYIRGHSKFPRADLTANIIA
jgi:hypothetical protein